MFGKRILLGLVLVLFVLVGCTKADSEDDGSTPGANVNTEAAEFGEDFGTTRPEFSSETAPLTVSENVKLTFENLDDAIEFLQDSKILDQVADIMPFGSEDSEIHMDGCMMETPDGDMIPCDQGEFGPDFGPDGPPDGFEDDSDGDFQDEPYFDEEAMEEDEDWGIGEMGDDVIEFLEENVFVDSQLESDEEGTVVYLLDAEIFCEMDGDEPGTSMNSFEGGVPDASFMPPEGGEPCEEECPEGMVCVDGECYDEADFEWSEEEGDSEWREDDGDPDWRDDGFEGGDWGEGMEMESEEGDDICADLLAEIPVRLQFTSKVDGEIQVAILFGDDKHNPIRFEMSATLVALEVDLAAMLATVEEIIEVLDGGDESNEGDDMEEAEQDEGEPVELENLAGVLRLSLENTGEKKMKAAFGIVEKMILEIKHGEDQYKAELGSLLLGAEADGSNESISAEFALEDLSLIAPYAMAVDMMEGGEDCSEPLMTRPRGFDGRPGEGDEPWREPPGMDGDPCGDDGDDDAEKPEGTLSVSLSGVSASGIFSSDEDAESVQVTGIGLGKDTTTVKFNDETLLSVDLNANDGRLFDLTFTMDDEDNATFEFVPALDLVVGMNLVSVVDDLEPPEWMVEETLTLNLSGADAPSMTALAESENGAMRVNAGTLTISAASMPDKTLTVEAGMCMQGEGSDDEGPDEEDEDDGANHPLDELYSLECPE